MATTQIIGVRAERSPGAWLLLVACLTALLWQTGCAGPRPPFTSADPLTDLRNPDLPFRDRLDLIDQIERELDEGTLDRQASIATLKDIAWSRRLPSGLRVPSLVMLLREPGLLAEEEARTLVTTMLPTERDQAVTAALVRAAVDGGWTEVTPMIVRRYAHEDAGTSDRQRIERTALEALHPGQTAEATIFEVFTDHGPRSQSEYAEQTRRDAWNLLSRLDRDGSIRVDLLGNLAGSDADTRRDPMLAALRLGLLELRTIPLSGEELEWLLRLADFETGDNDLWWSQANAIIRTLDADQRRGLRLRHAEPLRIAAEKSRDRTRISREALLDVLRERLEGRETFRRSASGRTLESLDAWEDQISYGDLVAILAVDDAIQETRVRLALFEQAEEDRSDTTTEYGGLLKLATNQTTLGSFTAVSYPPRPVTRVNDQTFVASKEMIEASSRALAHYHFHVQRERNKSFAGPSESDLRYAELYGPTCVVFTSVGVGLFNADVYLPTGVVIDLGTIRRPQDVRP
ncbi:MAG: hypothetical protein AAGB48_11225 [Planctomycetota bacterium]